MISIAIVAAMAGPAPAVAPLEEQKPLVTTIFVVRHAEKTPEQLISPIGEQRAKALAAFMALQNVGGVYSTDTQRTRKTAEPTANAANVKVQKYKPEPGRTWCADVAKKHAGQSVLIVGHSNTVVPIVNNFGAKMTHKIDHDEYHSLFIVRVVGKDAQAVRVNFGKVPAMKKKPVAAKKKEAVAP